MKYRSHNARRDQAEPAIVDALEKAGWEVHRELAVDLLVLKRVSREQLLRALQRKDGSYLLPMLLEAKTARGKKNPKAAIDKRQIAQNEFCERWEIDKPTCAMEALLAVGEKVVL